MKSRINKAFLVNFCVFCAVAVFFVVSLAVGKYPLSFSALFAGDEQQLSVFLTLRLPRTLAAVTAGVVLAVAGSVYQTVFKNPLAAPDIIGVASGASSGAAFAILFLSASALATTFGAFVGGMLAVAASLLICSAVKSKSTSSIVLAGIAVNAFFQMILMWLKLAADPEKQLASIEYWIMGSLNAITLSRLIPVLIVSAVCVLLLFLLNRQVAMLSYNSEEAQMLGVPVRSMRALVLIISTLSVSSVISITGLISFAGLIAPHIARMLIKTNRKSGMLCSALTGALLMLIADIAARSAGQSELPLSIFTSLIGAPFLVFLLVRRKGYE